MVNKIIIGICSWYVVLTLVMHSSRGTIMVVLQDDLMPSVA